MSDINLNAVDKRQHSRLIVNTICRCTLAAIVAVTCATAWRCDSTNDESYWRGRATACEIACERGSK